MSKSSVSTPNSDSDTALGEPFTPTASQGASPYSTGGGGVSFERKVAVKYLAHLLTGDTAVELGDGRAVVSVAFQQAPEHPVDDLVLRASRPDEATPSLVLAIGVRRAPNLVKSDKPTQKLIRDYVRAVLTFPATGDDGSECRLALVVAGSQQHTEQLAELADVAAKQMNASAFFELIHTPKKYSAELRDRLDHFKALVRQALTDLHQPSTEELAKQQTWQLLVRLTVLMPRLEAPDEADWAELQNRLVGVARGTDLAGASQLRDRLVALAQEYPSKAATIDLTLLRRDAHAALETTVRRHRRGWQALNHLHDRALASVRHDVCSRDGIRKCHVDREQSAAALLTAIADGLATVVHGESGVGKSAMALSAIANPITGVHDQQAVCINLRHLPSTTLELERDLGSPLSALLDELSAPQRYLVIDGADAIAEGADDSFSYLIDAARASGVKVVAISTGDCKQTVFDSIRARLGADVNEHIVEPLTDAEIDSIIETFTELSKLSGNARSRELLRRLVVVDLLVRSGITGIPLSDADAMGEVWKGLVRRHEKSDRGSPAAREIVFMRLGALALQGGDPLEVISTLNPEALDGLRHDGLLRASSDDPYTVCPEFAHDEVRRYAVARLLLQNLSDPTSKLIAAGAPRWALAAVQIACQAALALPDKPATPLRGRLSRLQAAFDAIVEAGHGERWGDVPGEALLTMSDPTLVLRDAWPELRANGDTGLNRLARLVEQRHRGSGLVSIVVVEPLVSLIIEDTVSSRPDEHIFVLLRDWLRAHAFAGTPTGHPLRIRLQKQLVALCDNETRRFIGEETIELLALLGPDLGGEGEALLKNIGAKSPWRLQPAVESLFAGQALALLKGGLLAELTETYYVDDGEKLGYPRNGIRGHDARSVGVFSPLAAWHRGPFYWLFRSDFRRGVAVLNRMLNHATIVRVRTLAELEGQYGESAIDQYRVELHVTGERTVYVGDSHAWFWYRGTGVGPYPCMSALQALERFCDQLIEAGAPLADLIKILLDGCENLAMVGLVVGLLIRHLEKAGRLLDPYLVDSLVWRLEFARATAEMQPFATRSNDLASERRKWSLRDATMMMVGLLADEERVAELCALGALLVDNECRSIAEAIGCEVSEVRENDDPLIKERFAEVRVWAACLDRSSYSFQRHNEGIVLQVQPPADAAQILEQTSKGVHRGLDALRLTMRYKSNGQGVGPSVTVEDLEADIAIVRELLKHSEGSVTSERWDAAVAVSAYAIEAHLLHGVALSNDSLEFASATVLRAMEAKVETRQYDYEGSYFEHGADRSAARVVSLFLLPAAQSLRPMLDVGDGQNNCQRALTGALSFGRSMVNEVRLHLARGLDWIWQTPCAGEACHHDVGFRVAVESMRDCVLGSWNHEKQRRNVLELDDPIDTNLSECADDRIIFARLDASIRALAVAATASTCVSSRARDFLLILLDAQRRALLSNEHNMDDRGTHTLVSARAVLKLANSGDSKPMFDHIDAYADNPTLLETLLRALSAAAEEDPSLAATARRLWPSVIKHVLALDSTGHDPFGQRHDGSRTLAWLLPNPTHESSYLYQEVADTPIMWWEPEALLAELDTWIRTAAGDAKCVDQFIGMLAPLPPVDQIHLGLRALLALAQKDTGEIARHSFLISDWLIMSQAHAVDSRLQAEWQQLVDALVVAGRNDLASYST